MKIDKSNLFAYRCFLVCNELANAVLGNGIIYQNFAELLLAEENGRSFNSQMTKYFQVLEEKISDLYGNDTEWMWEFLSLEEVAKISTEQLKSDYYEYCINTDGDKGKVLNFHF